MPRKPATLAALEVSPHCLRFVEMAREERRVVSVGTIALDSGRWHEREHLEARARSLIAVAAKGRIERLIASVPAAFAHFRVVEAPADAADDYLSWETSLYLGKPAAEYAIGSAPLGDNKDGARRHAVAAFRREKAVAVRDALQAAAGLPLSALDVDAAALANLLAADASAPAPAQAILIHAERHAATALRLRDGRLEGLALEREGGEALRPESDDQERAEGLLRRVRGLHAALARAGEEWGRPEGVLLCGEFATDADFQELLRAQFAAPLHPLNPYAGFPGPDPEAFPQAWPGGPYAVAVGLALRLSEDA